MRVVHREGLLSMCFKRRIFGVVALAFGIGMLMGVALGNSFLSAIIIALLGFCLFFF
ncbi:MAG: hypothetical protein LBL35_01345 [Clostridiales bacterium]|nr:hypothetical protein [Clostridiales bacterium]